MKRIMLAALFMVLVVGACALWGHGQEEEPEVLRGSYTFSAEILEYVIFEADGQCLVYVDEATEQHPFVIYIEDSASVDALYCDGREISLGLDELPVTEDELPVTEATWKPSPLLIFIVSALLGAGLCWLIGG